MIVLGRCFCDLCSEYLGQVWNEPACAPDLLPANEFRVCDDCFIASEPLEPMGDRPILTSERNIKCC